MRKLLINSIARLGIAVPDMCHGRFFPSAALSQTWGGSGNAGRQEQAQPALQRQGPGQPQGRLSRRGGMQQG
jgi:hypothetical protein